MKPDSVTERNVGFQLSPALLTGRVDATLGGFWNYEGTDLRLRGKNPQIIKVEDAGVPAYDELVLVANEDALERDAGRIRAFIGALSRGSARPRAESRRGHSGPARRQPRPRPEAPARGREVTLPLFVAPEGRPYGLQDPARVGRVRRLDDGERPGPGRRRTPASAFTNELLPGAGLLAARVLVQLQRQRVDAEALARRAGAVGEDVAQVGAAVRRQRTSSRIIPWLWSGRTSTASATAGSVKLGQPVPESNLASELNSAVPQAPQRYIPSAFE